jgi:hypothetical protein
MGDGEPQALLPAIIENPKSQAPNPKQIPNLKAK